MRFNPEAQQKFDGWLEEWMSRLYYNPKGLPATVICHLSKYQSLMPKLAAIYTLADRAAGGQPLWLENDLAIGDAFLIDSEHVEQAIKMCSYLEAHMCRIYGSLVTAERAATLALAKHIQKGELGKGEFSLRDLYRRHWTGLDDPESARVALQYLETLGWIRYARRESNGRPSDMYVINPKVFK